MGHGVLKQEPEFTIYGRCWDDARARVAWLSSARARSEHGAILDYLEQGWAFLRPLQLEAERMMERRNPEGEGGGSGWVGDFVDLSVTEEFRDLALTCRDAVGANARVRTGTDMADQAEVVMRALRVLGMAACSPEFPLGLRGCIADAVEGFGRWMPGLRPLLAPLEKIAWEGCGPVAVAALRVMD